MSVHSILVEDNMRELVMRMMNHELSGLLLEMERLDSHLPLDSIADEAYRID